MLLIELNTSAEARLRAQAQAQGVAAEAYARTILEGVLLPASTEGQRLVEQWKQDGVIGSRPDITDSSPYAEALREKAWERRGE